MRFLSVDIECNQPSGTIIQIGAVAWDTDKGLLGGFDRHLRPDEPINWDHQLTNGKTLGQLLPFGPQDIADAEPSAYVFKEFRQFLSANPSGKKIIQWGRGDMWSIHNQSNIDINRLRVLNLKVVYQFFFQMAFRLPKGAGLQTAMNSMGLKFEGPPPRWLCIAR